MPPYSALIDAATSALLAVSQYPYIVVSLVKSPVLEAELAHGINWPNYRKNFPLIKLDSKVYPEWTWEREKRLFLPTSKGLLTAELRQRSALAVGKCCALSEIVYELSVVRYSVWRGPLIQETVYITKKLQAQRYKDAGYPGGESLLYPYVLQYADYAGLTMRAAADEILFKALLDDELLSKTELLRLKYFRLVGDATEVDALASILKEFRIETYNRGGII